MGMITLKFDGRTEKTIEHLKEHFGATSKAEIFRKAIALLDIAAEVQDENGKLMAKRGDIEREIVIR